jgi:hypothetical protein
VELGFQGQDPTTDLRGSGLLGLRNLYSYVTQSKNSIHTFEIASSARHWYFFSASGINFTGKVIQLIESGQFDDELSHYKEDTLTFTNFIYDLLFTNFNDFWLKKNYGDFMKFNLALEEFIKYNFKIIKTSIQI